jgi:hypothetical protein
MKKPGKFFPGFFFRAASYEEGLAVFRRGISATSK